MADEENRYYGKDCPVGMVQVESVLGVSEPRSAYGTGWKPSKYAMIDVYVDGRRFCIQVGEYETHEGMKRGLHIATDHLNLVVDKHSLNSVDMFFADAPNGTATEDQQEDNDAKA